LHRPPDVSQIRAIFFDLDGTLTDYEASVDYAMTKLWDVVKDDCPLELAAFLRAQWEFLEDLENKDARGEVPRKLLKDRKTRTEMFLNSVEPGLVERFNDVGEDYSRYRREGITVYSGTKEALAELGERYAMGVITEGAGQTQRSQLKEACLIDLLEHIVISDEVGLHKPDVALYGKACEMAAVQPHQVALVGDRIDWDIAPAASIGMLTVLSRQQKHYRINETGDVSPDFTITTVNELLTIFHVGAALAPPKRRMGAASSTPTTSRAGLRPRPYKSPSNAGESEALRDDS